MENFREFGSNFSNNQIGPKFQKFSRAKTLSAIIMKGSVEGRRKYLFCCDFSSCSESAEIWHAYSFCVKKCPCGFFFKKAEKYGPHYTKIHPSPLCPSPNIVGFRSLRTKTLCMCVFYNIGGGGGGGRRRGVWTFKSVFEASFRRLWKKNTDIFWHEKSRHAKFQRIPSNLKNRNEIGTYASLPQSPSYAVWFFSSN